MEGSYSDPKPQPPVVIREVWSHNLDSEFKLIGDIVDRHPFVSMDTEFPGVIYRIPPDQRLRPSDYYRTLKSNVEALNVIQVGLALSDSVGNLPDLGTDGEVRFVWQFNFRDFDVARDPHASDSVELLRRQGIDFERNRVDGIASVRFAELLQSSGLRVRLRVSGQGADPRALPKGLPEFMELLKFFFGNRFYDVKYLMQFCQGLYGGLNRVAAVLKVERVAGKSHQAGSDSLLTWHVFRKMRDLYFVQGGPQMHDHACILYGLDM
ncbi:hypothetical protein SAY86_031562 [Trapa natans]|uniref:poly(A)-specific ribonuclease n=1 Tax=Trapa natans TaxID=22666 RepID=A0AAN7R3M4_TRANT|nr:hypothetical protein SAY86_031562 [Trapa natans]